MQQLQARDGVSLFTKEHSLKETELVGTNSCCFYWLCGFTVGFQGRFWIGFTYKSWTGWRMYKMHWFFVRWLKWNRSEEFPKVVLEPIQLKKLGLVSREGFQWDSGTIMSCRIVSFNSSWGEIMKINFGMVYQSFLQKWNMSNQWVFLLLLSCHILSLYSKLSNRASDFSDKL